MYCRKLNGTNGNKIFTKQNFVSSINNEKMRRKKKRRRGREGEER